MPAPRSSRSARKLPRLLPRCGRPQRGREWSLERPKEGCDDASYACDMAAKVDVDNGESVVAVPTRALSVCVPTKPRLDRWCCWAVALDAEAEGRIKSTVDAVGREVRGIALGVEPGPVRTRGVACRACLRVRADAERERRRDHREGQCARRLGGGRGEMDSTASCVCVTASQEMRHHSNDDRSSIAMSIRRRVESCMLRPRAADGRAIKPVRPCQDD